MIFSQINATDILHSDPLFDSGGKPGPSVSPRKLIIKCIGKLLLCLACHDILHIDRGKLRQIAVFIVRIFFLSLCRRNSASRQHCRKKYDGYEFFLCHCFLLSINDCLKTEI